eukprot:scaffold1637_cov410-Prasinococcus_capsulatus_cf.AAC.10
MAHSVVFGSYSGPPWCPPARLSSDATAAEDQEMIRALRDELARVQSKLEQNEEMHQQQISSMKAESESEIARVKSQAVVRIKELMQDVEAAGHNSGRVLEQQSSPATVTHAHVRTDEKELEEKNTVISTLEKANSELKQENSNLKMKTLEIDSAAAMKLNEVTAALDEAEKKATRAMMDLKKESVLRKKFYNEIRILKGNIRVCARVRPAITDARGTREPADMPVSCLDEFTLQLAYTSSRDQQTGSRGSNGLSKQYEFDRCFHPQVTQEEVYAELQALLQSARDGYAPGMSKTCVIDR